MPFGLRRQSNGGHMSPKIQSHIKKARLVMPIPYSRHKKNKEGEKKSANDGSKFLGKGPSYFV